MSDNKTEIRELSKGILRLSPVEYQYLRDGSVSKGYIENGTKRTDKLDNNVQDRIDILPQRLAILFEDIELLSRLDHTGLTRTDAWINCWLGLLELNFESPRFKEELRDQLEYKRPTRSTDRSAPEKFGEKIGQLLWNLFSLNPPGVELNDVFQNIIWGIIVRIADRISDNPDKFKLEMVEEFQERAELESNSTISRTPDIVVPDKEREQAICDHITELLVDMEKVPNQLLEQNSDDDTDDRGTSEYPWITYAVADLISKQDPDSTMTDWVYGDDTVDWSPTNNITRELLSELLDENRLIERQRLFKILDTDVKSVKAKQGKGPNATQVLNCIAASEDSMSSRDIADEIKGSKDWSSGVTELARDLAGHRNVDEYPHREIWSDRPLLKGDKDGWELTPYGEALNCCLENEELWEIPTRHPPLSETLLETVLDNIIVS